jgi:uncharacterized protein (TIGR02646 family)
MSDVLRVHSVAPARRTDVPPQTRYPLYRDDIRQDFANACGYCGDDDERADRITFHIDHFAPKKLFPQLEVTYSNLVYSCRFCNVSKSDHWVGTNSDGPNDGSKGFVDPCAEEFNDHLERDSRGRIIPQTDLGRYMIKRLKLHLLRHELLWLARKARGMRDQVDRLIADFQARDRPLPEYTDLLLRFRELTKLIEDYELRAAPR